ncbi:MAG: D-aminoacyl-tRNA deacylase, partial [Kiritimatiellae bacterium]|nr:D-aminoacyl-tRNA deacylase [Kiritimatiellia bacterium]
MKAWIQRVANASVEIDQEKVASIGCGFLVLLGVTHSDTPAMAEKMAEKIATIRLFEDECSHMNRSLDDVHGDV